MFTIFLLDEKIDLEVLTAIKPHHFERLLEPFNLRTLIMFERNLEQWRDSIGFPLANNSEKSYNIVPHFYTTLIIVPAQEILQDFRVQLKKLHQRQQMKAK